MGVPVVKVIVVLIALAAIYPAGLLLRRKPTWWPLVLFVIGFLPFFNMEALTIAFFYDYDLTIYFRGETRGLEISVIDMVAGVLWVAMPPSGYPAPFRKTRWAYMAMALLSVAFAVLPVYSLFSIWRLLRVFFVFGVVARALQNPGFGPMLIRGLAAGVLWAFAIAMRQKLSGLDRVFGPFPHPNTYAMAVNLVFPVALAIVLAGQGRLLAVATCIAGGLAVILTLSRASLVLVAAGTAVLVVASLRRGFTKRKLLIVGGAVAAAVLVLAVMANSIIDRFLNAPAISGEARELFKKAASLMFRDHSMGIGINNFSYVLRHNNYAARVGLPQVDADGIVHNIYWLTLVEMGVQGLIAYLLMIAAPVWLAVRTAWVAKRTVLGDVVLGLAVGLLVFDVQGATEWASRQSTLLYLHWICAAAIAGLARQAGVLRDGPRMAVS